MRVKLTYTGWHTYPESRKPAQHDGTLFIGLYGKERAVICVQNTDASKQMKIRIDISELRRLRNILNTMDMGE